MNGRIKENRFLLCHPNVMLRLTSNGIPCYLGEWCHLLRGQLFIKRDNVALKNNIWLDRSEKCLRLIRFNHISSWRYHFVCLTIFISSHTFSLYFSLYFYFYFYLFFNLYSIPLLAPHSSVFIPDQKRLVYSLSFNFFSL